VRMGQRLLLWRPYRREQRVAHPRVQLTLRPYEAAVLLALGADSGA
jgi:hypothetical protein